MSNLDQLHVEIISPSGCLFDGYCHMATIPGTNGDLGIMHDHEPTLTRLRSGKISVYSKDSNKSTQDFEVSGGFAHNVESKLLILVDEEIK